MFVTNWKQVPKNVCHLGEDIPLSDAMMIVGGVNYRFVGFFCAQMIQSLGLGEKSALICITEHNPAVFCIQLRTYHQNNHPRQSKCQHIEAFLKVKLFFSVVNLEFIIKQYTYAYMIVKIKSFLEKGATLCCPLADRRLQTPDFAQNRRDVAA